MASKPSIKKSGWIPIVTELNVDINLEAQAPEPFFTNFPEKPMYNDMWFDDPIEGEEAIRMAATLQHKIEEKATPIRVWLEKNIVPLLLQALTALVAFRPSNPCEFLAAHLLKNNPLKDTYPEDEPKPKKVIEEPTTEVDNEYDPCGCDHFKKPKDLLPENPLGKEKEPSPAQLAKKSLIAAEAKKGSAAPDPVRESVPAKAKAGSTKK